MFRLHNLYCSFGIQSKVKRFIHHVHPIPSSPALPPRLQFPLFLRSQKQAKSIITAAATSTSTNALDGTHRLAGKVAVVTGSSSGLGRAIALAFSAQGTRFVVCADLDAGPPAGEDVSTHELIRRRFGEQSAGFFRTDVGVEEDLGACVEEAVKKGGRLDVMVNNAGLGFKDVQMHEMKVDTWDLLMKINLRGVFLGSKHACNQFLKQSPHPNGHRGWIINTASGAGLKGVAGGATAYCASQGAVVNFTRAVALDYAKHKIHVNALCPGYLHTPMTQKAYDDAATSARMMAQTPWGTWGKAEDVANVAVFLASEDAAWVTGAQLCVDGGWAAG